MNIGLIIGKKNSVGVPGKNTKSLLGRPSAEYAFIASEKSNLYITLPNCSSSSMDAYSIFSSSALFLIFSFTTIGVAVMNSLLFARMLLSSSTHPNASEVFPVHRCASSAKTMSNALTFVSFCAAAINGEDW